MVLSSRTVSPNPPLLLFAHGSHANIAFFRSSRGKIFNCSCSLSLSSPCFSRRARRLLASGEGKLFVGYYYHYPAWSSTPPVMFSAIIRGYYYYLKSVWPRFFPVQSRARTLFRVLPLIPRPFCRCISFLNVIYFFLSPSQKRKTQVNLKYIFIFFRIEMKQMNLLFEFSVYCDSSNWIIDAWERRIYC